MSTGRLGREARACRMGGKNWVPAVGVLRRVLRQTCRL